MSFRDLELIDPLMRAVRARGYRTPTAIQRQAIPPLLEGRDLLGSAQTGSGKTAAFALPILQRFWTSERRNGHPRPVRALVLAPTRELALQIGDSFASYGRYTSLNQAVILGGVRQEPQRRALRGGVDILVATPGRLLDLHSQGYVHLGQVEVLVLDEADRMLDMGFIHDVRRIIGHLPRDRQSMLFSATMPESVLALGQKILIDPLWVEATPTATTPESIDHAVYFVERRNKRDLLRHLLLDPDIERALVFTRTKRRADRVARHLLRESFRTQAIHGDKSQARRQRAMDNFRSGRTRVLVATDVAARGLDIEGLSHVINFDVPEEAERYVHRIGRTGRMEAVGMAVSFCGFEERPNLADIERLIRMPIPVIESHPFQSPISPPLRREDRSTGKTSRVVWRAGLSRRPGRLGRPRVRRG